MRIYLGQLPPGITTDTIPPPTGPGPAVPDDYAPIAARTQAGLPPGFTLVPLMSGRAGWEVVQDAAGTRYWWQAPAAAAAAPAGGGIVAQLTQAVGGDGTNLLLIGAAVIGGIWLLSQGATSARRPRTRR